MKSFSIKSRRTFSEKSSDKYKKFNESKNFSAMENLDKEIDTYIKRFKSDDEAVKGLETKASKLISLARRANVDYDQLKRLVRSRFNESKNFSKIVTEEEFREYAHNVMKNAHGDKYSEEVTNKVVDDLIKNNPDADYGELIGRLTSGFGDKTMSTSINRTFSEGEHISLAVYRFPDEYTCIIKMKDDKFITPSMDMSIDSVAINEGEVMGSSKYKGKSMTAIINQLKSSYNAHLLDWSDIDIDSIEREQRWEKLENAHGEVEEFSDKSFADTEVGTVTIRTSNPKRLGELIQMIKDHGNVGHSFECKIDTNGDNPEDWSWDGDGSDHINDIEIEYIVRESRTFSIAEDREFAHGRGYKVRQLEVKRLQDLYDDVKSKQKDSDPSQKLRNRMLLQEIKVQLEEAKYDFYKHAYEESKL